MADVIVLTQDRGDYVYERVEHRDAGGNLIATTERDIWKPGTISANADDLRAKAVAALGVNAAFLALAAPTNAQTLTQVQRLTRECNGLIRLLLGALDETAGT